jgi:aquaporin Z
VRDRVLAARLVTEFVGTLVFLTVIAISSKAGSFAPLVIGCALMVMVYMGGHISGAHYNPAVSLGVFLRRKISLGQLFAYWVAQVVAAIFAFWLGYALTGIAGGIHPHSANAIGSAITVEVLFTAALVLVVLNVAATPATQGNSFYGLAIGFTIVVGAFVAGPISGGGFNPAVGLGATVVGSLAAGGSWSDLWIYLVAPLAGAAIAAGIHQLQEAAWMAGAKPAEGEPSPGAPAPVPRER